jgi:Uma2 family endonuclease
MMGGNLRLAEPHMALPQFKRQTYADYLALPASNKRYELVNGEFWLMAGAGRLHQRAVGEMARQLGNQLAGKPCRLFIAPFDVRLADISAGDIEGFESNVVQPDLLIVCDRSKETPTSLKGAPDVVIEVLSPGGSARDLVGKRRLYERAGVNEYWVFDPEGRALYRHLLQGASYVLDIQIARGALDFHSMPLSIDFDAIECAEGFVYPDDL